MSRLLNFKIKKFNWKNFISKFKGKSEERGWLRIKDKHLAFDKQKHAVVTIPFALTCFGLLIETKYTLIVSSFMLTYLLTTLVTSFVCWIIGFIWEFFQKFTKNGNYQPHDAHIMFIMAFAIGLFLTIWNYFRFHVFN